MDTTSALGRHLAELGWTTERLAREINRCYGAGTVSAKAPYGWLKGSFPRGRVPELVAEVLSEHLDRLVHVDDVWPGRGDRADVRSLTWLGIDLDWTLAPEDPAPARRPVEYAPDQAVDPVPGSAVVAAVADWMVNDWPPARSRPGGRWLPAAAGEAALRRSAETRSLGGTDGLGPEVHADWLRQDLTWVGEMARDFSFDATTGRLVFRALAELAELAGCATREPNAVVAQRFFLLGLRAAGTATDRPLGCHLVSCLADVSLRLGDHEHAALLTRLAHTEPAEEPSDGRDWIGCPAG